ncbi:hypothetical protein BJY59DRAFT_698541 [Rhodotorula toruloides]
MSATSAHLSSDLLNRCASSLLKRSPPPLASPPPPPPSHPWSASLRHHHRPRRSVSVPRSRSEGRSARRGMDGHGVMHVAVARGRRRGDAALVQTKAHESAGGEIAEREGENAHNMVVVAPGRSERAGEAESHPSRDAGTRRGWGRERRYAGFAGAVGRV